MAIIINKEKVSNAKEFINRADYEYTLSNTFTNATIVVGVISIYATFAYITISYLGRTNPTNN